MPPFFPRLLPVAQHVLARVLVHAWSNHAPDVAALVSDPLSTTTRIGDAIVWSGPAGQKVIGGLESIAESQSRIDSAIGGIETAQLGLQSSLGLVQSVSVATLGISSLTGAFLAYRLTALERRVTFLSQQIADVDAKINAMHKAFLRSSLQYLREYDERSEKDGNTPNNAGLDAALKDARSAANIYGEIAHSEASARRCRLSVLNCRSRLYVVALLTELRCLVSSNEAGNALSRIDEERNCLKEIATKCFKETLGKKPERFLRPSFQEHGVTLNVMSEIYQNAKQLGVIDEPAVSDANDLFEHMRKRISNRKGWLGFMKRDSIKDELASLNYLLACLEECAKVEGLGLLIKSAGEKGTSPSELFTSLKQWRSEQSQNKEKTESQIFAYSF